MWADDEGLLVKADRYHAIVVLQSEGPNNARLQPCGMLPEHALSLFAPLAMAMKR